MDMSLVPSSNVKVEAEDMPAVMTNDFDDEDNLSMIDFFDANDLLCDDELNNIQPAARHENFPEMTMTMPPEMTMTMPPEKQEAERRTSIDFARELLWSSDAVDAAAHAVEDDIMAMSLPMALPMAVPSSSCTHLATANDAPQHDMDVSNSSIGSYHTASSSHSGGSFRHHRSNSRSPPRKRIKNEEPLSIQHTFMCNSIDDSVSGHANAGGIFDSRCQRRQQQQQQQQQKQQKQQAAQYNDMLAKLAECMKRSEQSRAEIMRHRKSACHKRSVRSSSTPCAVPSLVTSSARRSPPRRLQQHQQQQQEQHNQHQRQRRQLQQQQPPISRGLAGFLSGSQSTLTIGLEQSRRQLAAYVVQMRPNQTM